MPPQPDLAKLRKIQDHENLRNMLIAWNANRLDLFELSMPNEVRFYYFLWFYTNNLLKNNRNINSRLIMLCGMWSINCKLNLVVDFLRMVPYFSNLNQFCLENSMSLDINFILALLYCIVWYMFPLSYQYDDSDLLLNFKCCVKEI